MLWPKAGGPKGWLKLVNIDGLKFAPKKKRKKVYIYIYIYMGWNGPLNENHKK